MTGYISSSRFVDHGTGPQHPERPDRIRAIAAAVRLAGLIDSANPFPEFQLDFGPFPAPPAKLFELPEPTPAGEQWLQLVHPAEYLDRIRDACAAGEPMLDGGDTAVCQQSFDIALLSAGALLQCCDAVMAGKVQRAFAAIRPPGHHAEPARAMGFCQLANVAIAARYLQHRHGVGKVAIVDFDVHHGNGTQAAFKTDPSVLFISLHQDPRTCYPGTGYEYETGVRNIINLPMAPGSDDADYVDMFHARVLPGIDLFKPEMLLISAGFDAHTDDPLAQINLTETCFEQMTQLLVESANAHTQGRIVSALEGGYDLRALGRSVVRHLSGLL